MPLQLLLLLLSALLMTTATALGMPTPVTPQPRLLLLLFGSTTNQSDASLELDAAASARELSRRVGRRRRAEHADRRCRPCRHRHWHSCENNPCRNATQHGGLRRPDDYDCECTRGSASRLHRPRLRDRRRRVRARGHRPLRPPRHLRERPRLLHLLVRLLRLPRLLGGAEPARRHQHGGRTAARSSTTRSS